MKKLLLILCLFSMTARGEWKYDGVSDTANFYIDYSRIKTEGSYKSMWYLADFKKPQKNSSGKVYKSEVIKILIDCKASRTQEVAFFSYSEQMSEGKVVDSGSSQIKESEWGYEPPNSIGDGFIKAACTTNSNPKAPFSSTEDNKRQRCISLGLAPGSADFQQCIK